MSLLPGQWNGAPRHTALDAVADAARPEPNGLLSEGAALFQAGNFAAARDVFSEVARMPFLAPFAESLRRPLPLRPGRIC